MRKLTYIFFLSVIFNLLIKSICFGQQADNNNVSLKDYGITKYPTLGDVENSLFDDDFIDINPLSHEDINTNFSNIDDLEWLKTIAIKNKVILFGELHYFQYVHNLRNRIFFALNNFDYYPLLILEAEYSITPFLNHYVMIKDDISAKKFEDEIYNFICSESKYALIQHIRRWNKTHPQKLIRIACTDVEHDDERTIKKILIPYFNKIDNSLTPSKCFNSHDINIMFTVFDSLLVLAQEKQLVGKYKFITTNYIKNIITNLKSTFDSMNDDWLFKRQKAIIRNLSDTDFFGNDLRECKAMLYGGLSHTPTHVNEEDSISWEGTYLTNEFGPTKNKTFSITAMGLSLSLSQMIDRNLASCLLQGSAYNFIFSQMHDAYIKGLLNPKQYYFVRKENYKNDEFKKLIIKKSYRVSNEPILIEKIFWEKLLERSQKESIEMHKSLTSWKDFIDKYDAFIFVPKSPITIARLQKWNFNPKRNITFKVHSKVYSDSIVYITGYQVKLGSWNPGLIQLNKEEDGSWSKTFLFNEGMSINFKITRGTWDKEAVNIDGTVPPNSTFVVKGDSTINIIIENWKDIFNSSK